LLRQKQRGMLSRKRSGSHTDLASHVPQGASPRAAAGELRLCGFVLKKRLLALMSAVLVLHTAVTGARCAAARLAPAPLGAARLAVAPARPCMLRRACGRLAAAHTATTRGRLTPCAPLPARTPS
jgi:hypothetical protein